MRHDILAYILLFLHFFFINQKYTDAIKRNKHVHTHNMQYKYLSTMQNRLGENPQV